MFSIGIGNGVEFIYWIGCVGCAWII